MAPVQVCFDDIGWIAPTKNAPVCHYSDTQSGMNAAANALRLDG
jgi:hypothetical protein